MFPNLNLIAQIRAIAEDANVRDKGVVQITDPDLIDALMDLCDEALRIGAPEQDHFRLDLLHGLGSASKRALMAHQIVNLKELARAHPDDIYDYLEVEGVRPPAQYEQWPIMAAELVEEISMGLDLEQDDDDEIE